MAFGIYRKYFSGRRNTTNRAILAVHVGQPNPEIRTISFRRHAPIDAPSTWSADEFLNICINQLFIIIFIVTQISI